MTKAKHTHNNKQNLKVWVLRADWEEGQCNFCCYPKGKCPLCQNVEIVENVETVANAENYIMTENDTATQTEKVTLEDTIYTSSISKWCLQKVKQSSNWSRYWSIGETAKKKH